MSSVPSVLFFGTFDADRHPRVKVLLQGLEEAGWNVGLANEPLAVDTEARVALMRRPWTAGPTLLALARSWWRLWTRCRQARSPDVVLVGYLGTFDVWLAWFLFRLTSIVVLDDLAPLAGTATDRQLGAGPGREALAWLDRQAARRSDVVLVDTDEHRRHGKDIVVTVGATREWFAAAEQAEDRDDQSLQVVFFGLFTPLQGAPVIAEAIRLVDRAIQFTLVGTGQDWPVVAALVEGLPNVRHHPWIPADRLPAMVASHDVCLGIFGQTAKARRVVPNKVFQGMAAGCATITSQTAPQERMLGDAARLVPPGSPEELASTIVDLSDRECLEEWKARARAEARTSFHPAEVVKPLDDLLRTQVGA